MTTQDNASETMAQAMETMAQAMKDIEDTFKDAVGELMDMAVDVPDQTINLAILRETALSAGKILDFQAAVGDAENMTEREQILYDAIEHLSNALYHMSELVPSLNENETIEETAERGGVTFDGDPDIRS